VEATTGITQVEIKKSLVQLEAFGEIQGVPPPQLALILAKAKQELERPPSGVPPAGPPPP